MGMGIFVGIYNMATGKKGAAPAGGGTPPPPVPAEGATPPPVPEG